MKSRSSMPTQTDVAELAGVSTATVSRVINGSNDVKQPVRKRVQDAIERLHYLPHAGARALATRRSGTVGAIIPTLNNAIFAEGINAFERASQELGYSLILAVSHQDLRLEDKLVQNMIERGVEGLLLVGNEHNEQTLSLLAKSSVRHVCTWAYDASASAPNIGFDNALAMHDVVDHLVELGHRQIGMLAGITQSNDRALKRLDGTRLRLLHHGLNLPPERIVEVPYSIGESRRALAGLLSTGITALVCGNDVIAYGALLEAQKMQVSVPDELSIVGFDDLSLSAEFNPPLTTVHVGATAMGDASAKALIHAVQQSSAIASQCLPTRLVQRGTTSLCQR
ncbi:MAG: LacI family DNA-binding transcriptional regulator [Granulosicoccus sp.]